MPEMLSFRVAVPSLCTLDRIFDKASVFMMCGPSYRGRELDTFSVEAVPQATKHQGTRPRAP